MKTVIFVRHAKSSWEYDLPDRERPLKKRGKNDAKLVSKAFKETGFVPDHIFSSPANRAFTTCRIFMKNLSCPDDMLSKADDLYDFGGLSVLNFIKSCDDSLDKIMIFGHNHAFTSLVNSLGDRYIENFPTSGLAHIEIDVDSWKDVGKGRTVRMILPRDLK